MNGISWTGGITFALAVVGSLLGVLNTWLNINRDRVKLRVTPKIAVPIGDPDSSLTFCVEVTNLSAIPVTVSEVGTHYKGTDARAVITAIRPVTSPPGDFPRRLQPRSAFTVYSEQPDNLRELKCAFAKTDCGVVATGTSPAFKELIRTG